MRKPRRLLEENTADRSMAPIQLKVNNSNLRICLNMTYKASIFSPDVAYHRMLHAVEKYTLGHGASVPNLR